MRQVMAAWLRRLQARIEADNARAGYMTPAPKRPPQAMRRDPAPSIWAYRMQRVMLTPSLRRMLKVGVPVLLIAGAGTLYLASESRRAHLVGIYTDLREKFESRPEFLVTLASVEGASEDLSDAVRGRLGIDLPQSSFNLDLEGARARIEELDAVKSAELRVRSGGILQVLVTEREPVAVWRNGDNLMMIDDGGHRVAGLFSRSDRADLPLIAGQGADVATPEAMTILAATGQLAPRVRGLVRMGERRWDLVLDRNQRILLPSENPVRALERLLALDQAQDILARDIRAVDLRLPQRPTLRLTTFALNEIRSAQGLSQLETDL